MDSIYVINFDGFVKSPFATLRGILRHCGVAISTPHSSGFACLATGAFYCAVQALTFYEVINSPCQNRSAHTPFRIHTSLHNPDISR